MNILLIDDHRLFADAMAAMLGDLGDDTKVEVCHTAHRALAVLDSRQDFDLILLDLWMPDIDGFNLLRSFRSRKIKIPAVVVSAEESRDKIQAAWDNGAVGFVYKTTPRQELLPALNLVLQGQVCFPDNVSIDRRPPLVRDTSNADPTFGEEKIELNERQTEILIFMAAGNSNKQISHLLGVSEATVKYYTSQLFKLLGVRNRTSCIREATRLKLLS